MSTDSTALGTIDYRKERDRFVAFAFASADAFLELDGAFNILYAVGAVQWLSGTSHSQFIGWPMIECVYKADRPMVRAALGSVKRQGRFGPIKVRFYRDGDRPLRTLMFGSFLQEREDRIYLALSAVRMTSIGEIDEVALDPTTGVLNKHSFSDMAIEALKIGKEQEHNYSLTLLVLDGLEEVRTKLGEKEAEEFLASVTAELQVNSINGSSVGYLDGDSFGLVHEPGVDITGIEKNISARVQEADPGGSGIQIGAATVELESMGLSEADDGKALLYTINKFSESRGDFTITELNEGYKLMIKETKGKILGFREITQRGAFDIMFQPVVDLSTRFVHHYEALSRLQVSGPESSPYHFITFAEDVGVIGEFDLAVVSKVIEKITRAREHGDIISIAVNLSGRSIENAQIVEQLHEMLKSCQTIRQDLIFELTESAKISNLETTNNIVQSLRRLGHHVCLDDFGAGASAFQYLRALEVDYVKIDGIYVREALTTKNGKAFLRSMATLCRDINVQTVAEMVEEEVEVEFLREAEVRYGQGYLFGKPSAGISATQHR